MIRHFPFSQTYKNLAFNLKNFRPSTQRPSFKSVNHPFVPNAQLQDASYTKWLVDASSKLPQRIIKHLKPHPEHAAGAHHPKSSSPYLSSLSQSYYYIPRDYRVDDITAPGNVTEPILEAFEHDDLETVASLLEQHKAGGATPAGASGAASATAAATAPLIIEPDLVNIMVKLSLSEIPFPDFQPCELPVEVPLYRRHLHPHRTDSAFYTFIYERIPHLHRICKSYERIMFNDRDFQEYYIWLCFHQNDHETLQYLMRAYLKQQDAHDSKVLAYGVCSFLLSYDTTAAMALYRDVLLSAGAHLDPIFLESVLQSALQCDSLDEHVREMYHLWSNGERPLSPKVMALVVRAERITEEGSAHSQTQAASGATAGAAAGAAAGSSLPFIDHYMVRTQLLLNRILARHATLAHKPILEQDIAEINAIVRALVAADEPAHLKDFYFQLMRFFAVHQRNMNMVLFISHKMKQDAVSVDEKFVKLISRFYARSERFMSLLDFLRFSAQRVPFNRQYLADLYEGFVKTYPHYAREWDAQFQQWVCSRPELTEAAAADDLRAVLQLKHSNSTLTPCTTTSTRTGPLGLDPFKYDLGAWKPLTVATRKGSPRNGAAGGADLQLQYRIQTGFPALFARGIKPDFKLIEETYSHLPKAQRHLVLDVMKRSHSASPKKILAISRLARDKNPHNYLKDFVRHEGRGLNAQNRLTLAPVLMRTGLSRTATTLLMDIRKDELNDRGYMLRLTRLLWLNVHTRSFRRFVENIDEFPINEVVLSPYIYEKCCGLETHLVHRIDKEKQAAADTTGAAGAATAAAAAPVKTVVTKEGQVIECKLVEVPDEPLAVQMEHALRRLQGFLADIQVRLDSDKRDVSSKIADTFKLLTEWLDSESKDERKV